MPNSANISGQGVPPNQQQPEGTGLQRDSDPNLNLVGHPVGSNNDAAVMNVPSGSTNTRSRKSRSSKASSRALRASLDLQRLEEEKRLEKEFLARKYEILQAQLEDGQGSSSSGRTRRSSHGSSQRTHDWVQSQIVPTTSTTTEPPVIPVGTQSRTGTIPKDFPPAVAVTTSAMIMDESSVLDMRSLSINPNTVDQMAPKVQCAASSSFAPTRHRLAHLLAKNTDQTTAVNCATDCEGAVGGCTTISTDHRALPTAVNFSISPTRTPEALMEQLSFQQQLLAKTPCQGQTLDRHPDEPRHFQPTQSSTVNVPKPARKVAYDLPTSDGNNKVTSSVSQTCSNTISAFVPQLNVLSSVDLSLPTRAVEQINKTPPPPTGPCLLPPILPFVPAHMSTPQAHSTPPSVHTVSSRLSPIMSPMVPASAPITAPVSAANDVARRQLFGPTSQQLAARHVVPRELPAFTGDPVEWPLFLSCYQNTTDMCGYSDGENLMRLQRCLKGNALEAVRSHLMHPSSVPLIIDTLKTLYGRPEQIINSLLSKLHATPTPKSEHLESLIGFGLACKNLCSHLQAAGLQDHLSNPLLLQELVSKLPATLKLNWSLFKRQYAIADLAMFGSYMDQIVTAASEVTFLNEADGHRGKQEKPKTKEKMFVHTSEEKAVESVSANRQENKPKPCAACKKDGHRIKDCHSFWKMQLADRWKLVQERFLCRRCLGSHGKFPCKASNCGENSCEDRHHKLLHPGNPQLSRATDTPKTTSTVTVHRQFQQAVLFRIIPVSLHGNGKTIRTYAFLDDGSSKTLVETQVAEKLGVTGAIHPLCLQWTSGVERVEDDSQVIKLQISGATNSTRLDLKEVHTVKSLNLPVQSLDFSQLSEQFPHLQGLPVHSYTDAVPTILIGLDNSFVMTTRKSREGARGSPIAAKSRLGWTVYGSTSTEVEQSANQLFHISIRSPEQELHDLVKEFFALESVNATSSAIENDDDKRARQILEATTVRKESGRFQTGLLWKYDHVEFPNSRPMAEKRFRCLKRRLASKPDLYDNVKTQISQYQAKGYAHKASPDELASFDPKRTWFLPLNVVTNPRKPNKVRLVWDAAAKVQGQSFNSALLSGPDFLAPLPAVLSSFRQFEVAISADICEMFHQILIRPEDRSAQLFLWRDDPSKQFEVFVMDVATFGSTCSPSAAQYVKNRNAEEFADEFPQATEAITKHHYVDDFLCSVDTEQEAVELAKQVKLVHSKAGFDIRNWLSNSNHVLTRVGEQQTESAKKVWIDKSAAYERVLGMTWKPEPDVFVFQGVFREEIQVLLLSDAVPTKREVLRTVMSIFDPIGLVAIFVVHGKVLVQHIWRSGIGWDERISEVLLEQWQRWIKLLQQLDRIEIPRCYFPGYSSEDYRTAELHIFVDASEEAFAAVAYFRIVEGTTVRCSLVSAKTKVAPLKLLSIPRLELSAAVLGARLSKSVVENHTIPIRRKTFWSDSCTFLSWLRADPRKYRQFVAFRLTEIHDLTQVDEWRWVPSRLNVADEATKWGKGPDITSGSRWFQAPKFLYEHPDSWPQQTMKGNESSEELRPVHLHHDVAQEQLLQFGRFSKWERLVRAVAYMHRFVHNLRCKVKKQPTSCTEWLTRDELQRAETTIFKLIQHETFGDEIVILKRNQQLPAGEQLQLDRTSKIRKLSPFLDEQDVMRMDGRIAGAQQVSFDFKFPVILPKRHGGTTLLVDWYHRQYKHCNAETAVNEMRQRFHVSEMRVAFKQAGKLCQWCKVYKAVPEIPRMAPLPQARTVSHVRPFTYVGVDYFGPMLVKQGRSEVKRWVALFTCLTIRAVHLEVVHNLTTESCKMAVRRFVARRGAPREIFSDRGTNFVGANRDLKMELQQINSNLASTFTNTDTQWRFNPPSTPHMGGSWERMVRSVKSALASLSIGGKPDDETLRTLLVEAESIVNSRPLTYLPIDSEEQEALTPNCFLMLSTSGVNQPAREPIEERATARCNWDLCKQLLDRFWARWIKEYLPTITKRTKWFREYKPVQVGDLVIVVEDRVRNGWVRGRVVRVFPGRDGRIRNAEIATSSAGLLVRSVAKLAVLEVGGTAEVDFKQYGSGDVPNEQKPAPRCDRVTRSTHSRRS
ncbi:uncharacterized protein LOC134288349 [Aedes albopictus]|uniref:Integrase catalytic domain-containing protein n=1 Tax=Aedes albopictus TaxID=7160 RepID=A0ABM1ZC62_AEDAL